MFYAYILRSQIQPSVLYYGSTTNLKIRIAKHNAGGNLSTSAMRPWSLVWYGGFETEESARAFERYLKTASGKAFAGKRLISANP
jgi:predicted GIY-YIG superfamily endonuclease